MARHTWWDNYPNQTYGMEVATTGTGGRLELTRFCRHRISVDHHAAEVRLRL